MYAEKTTTVQWFSTIILLYFFGFKLPQVRQCIGSYCMYILTSFNYHYLRIKRNYELNQKGIVSKDMPVHQSMYFLYLYESIPDTLHSYISYLVNPFMQSFPDFTALFLSLALEQFPSWILYIYVLCSSF